MKILVVSDNPTHPPLAGNRSCIVAYCDLLRRMGHEVHLLYSHRPWVMTAVDLEQTREAWGDRFHLHQQGLLDRAFQILSHRVRYRLHDGYPQDSLSPLGFPKFVKDLCDAGRFQAVIVNYWSMTSAFLRLNGVRRILYAHDRFTGKAGRSGSQWLSTQAITEGAAFDRSDVVLAIQEEESEFFRTLTRRPVLSAFSHFPVVPQPASGTRNLLYLGGPNLPNVEGLTWFLREVWPLLHQRDPSIRFLVGGRICSRMGAFADCPGVEFQGDVDSIGAFYAQGDVSVNPTRSGTGLKIKTFEAMAHGKVLVCHPHSAEGIFQPETAPLTLASEPQEYVDAILGKFADPSQIASNSQQSIQYIRRLNDHVEAMFKKALEN